MNIKFLSTLFLIGFFCMSFSTVKWYYNFEEAKKIAQKEHKYILLNFSGSDWCGPCIRMHKDILETETFATFATKNLVMVNVDFPRLKKNQLSAVQQKVNDGIAERYNSQGIFPLTVLLTESGKILTQWEGYPKATTSQFVDEIKLLIDHAE
jgi:thioredoxin-related protein